MGIGWLPSYYSGAEVKCYIRHGEYDLLEVQDVEFGLNRSATPGGAGLGHPRNRYHKLGVPEGEFKISKNYLNSGEQADLFAQLIAGTTTLQTGTASAGADSYVATYRIVAVLYVRLATGVCLYEGTDYLIDYVQQTVVFTLPLAANATIVYMTDATGKSGDAMNGVHKPFVFDVEWRERDSGTVLKRLRGCMAYEMSTSSGENEEAFTEDLSGQFLVHEGRGVGSGVYPDGDAVRWLAVGEGSNSLAYSKNGVAWVGLGLTIFTSGFGCAYGNGLWVAVGSGTNHTIAYSRDGITWVGLGKTIFTEFGTCVWYANGLWLATGKGTNTLAYSTDGIHWRGLGASIFSTRGAGVTYGNGIWVAGGEGTNTLAYSTDGRLWTGLGASIFSLMGARIGYYNGLFVAGGSGATHSLAYSANGSAWTGLGKTIFTNGYNAVYGHGLWLAGGDGANGLAYSANGIAWTGLGVDEFEIAEDLRYGADRWIAVGGRYVGGNPVNAMSYSLNGTDWTDMGVSIFDYGYAIEYH